MSGTITDPRVDDLLGQVAAQNIQLENAGAEISDLQKRLDEAEGALEAKDNELKRLIKERRDDSSESPSKLKEQIKALVAKNRELEQQRRDAVSPEKLRAAVQDRVSLQTKAQAIMGDDFRCDELDDRNLMVTVIDRLYGPGKDKDAEGKERSLDYVRAMFDAAIDSHTQGAAAIARVDTLLQVKEEEKRVEDRLDAKSARQKMIERNRNAWQQEAK